MKIYIVFVILQICNVASNISISIIAPFYPTYAKQKQVSDNLIGLIFSAQPIGQFIGSLILGKLINQNNRSIFMNLGILIQGFSLTAFGSLIFIDGITNFIILSIIARSLGGIGASLFLTPLYAFIPLLYPSQIAQKIAITEICSSLGYLIGPIFGSVLYGLGGFSAPFYFFSISSIILSIILYFNSSKITLHKTKINLQINEYKEQDNQIKLSYLQLISKYPIFITYLAVVFTNGVWTFQNPIFAPYLDQKYNVSPENAGFYLSSSALSYGIGAFVVTQIKNYIKFYIYFALIFTSYLSLLLGPDKEYSGFDPSIWITMISWTLSGFTAAFPYILALPQLNTFLAQYYPSYPEQCANVSSAFYNSAFSLGGLLCPIIAGNLSTWLGYPRASALFGIGMLTISLFYIPLLFIRQLKPIKN